MVLPVAARKPETNSDCFALTPAPSEIAAIPAPTNVGVLGMTRTTGFAVPRPCSINEIFLPAAKVITTAELLMDPLISSRVAAISCGLTTRSNASAFETFVATSSTLIPYLALNSSARSLRFSEMVMESGEVP